MKERHDIECKDFHRSKKITTPNTEQTSCQERKNKIQVEYGCGAIQA